MMDNPARKCRKCGMLYEIDELMRKTEKDLTICPRCNEEKRNEERKNVWTCSEWPKFPPRFMEASHE